MRREDTQGVVVAWGEGTTAGDRSVILQLFSSLQDSRMCTMDEALCDAVMRKIEAKPALLKQFFVFFMQQQQTDSLPRSAGQDLYLVTVTDNIFRSADDSSKRVVWLLLLASMFEKAEWVENLTWDIVGTRWRMVANWIIANREYCVYDRESGYYLVSEVAARNKDRVATFRQQWWTDSNK